MLYLMYFLLYLFIFILGICIGSFINVIVYRLPNNISFKGRSFCPNCKKQIKTYDLIPLLSFFILKRKCRHCKSPISFRYPLIELFVGILAVIIFIHYYFTAKALLVFGLCAVLVAIALIDYDKMIIPDILVFLIIPLSVISFSVFGEISVVSRVSGVFFASAPLLIFIFFKKEAFGVGDIKLIAASGLFLGFKLNLLAFFMAAIFAGIYILIKSLLKKLTKEDHIPFGPFLCTGIMLSLMYGQKPIELYLNFLDNILKGIGYA